MKKILFSVLFSFIILSMIPNAFSQSSIITFEVDADSFKPGEIVELSGSVDKSLVGQPVAVEIKDSGGNVILIRTITPDKEGNFDLKFKIPSTATPGEFEITTNIEIAGEAITETKSIVGPDFKQQVVSENPVCGQGTVLKDGQCVPVEQEDQEGGGCLIATATFGSELVSQVQQLRELRDNTLLKTQSGSLFMKGFNHFYYLFSPTIADWERQNPALKEAVKITITPLLTSLSILNYVGMDSESEVLTYGISLILLNIGMYFVAPAIVILQVKKRF